MTDLDLLYQATGPVADWDDGTLRAWLAGPAAMLQPIDDLCRDDDIHPGWSNIFDVTRCPTKALPWLGQLVGVRLAATLPDAWMRAAVEAEQGFKRGTVPVIEQAAAPFLRPGGSIVVTERFPDPYSIQIGYDPTFLYGFTYDELADAYPTYDDLAAAFTTYDDFTASLTQFEAAIRLAIPAGLIVSFVVMSIPERDFIDGGSASAPALNIADGGSASAPATDWIDGGTP